MQLTNNGSFYIMSMYIGHSAGIAGIIKHLWNIKTILVTNLLWVTWNPSVSRWRVSICWTVESYTLLYTNNMLSLKFNNCGWICTSNWKRKNQINKQHLHLHRDISEWLVFNNWGVQRHQHTYIQEGILNLGWCFLVGLINMALQNVLLICFVVSIKLLLSEYYLGDPLAIHKCMFNKLLVPKVS